MKTKPWLLATAALLAAAPLLQAQNPQQKSDSLENEIRLLKARLDSLQEVVARLVRQGEDTTEAVDELAALRAAAQAAAQEAAGGEKPDTGQTQFVSRTRNLNRLNPEISVTGDVRALVNRPGPQEDNFDLREFEFAFQSALDPYANTKIFLSLEDDQIDAEEAYIYWTGLPAGLRVDVGRFRQQIGELNRIHLHALPETEYPLVLREYLGEDGLVGDGVSFYWVAPVTPFGNATHEVWAQVTLADNEALFDDGRRLSYMGHLNNFWQLSRSTYLQVGGTALYGRNPDSNIATRVLGTDFRVTWRPPEKALYRSATVRGELYAARKRVSDVGSARYGGYLGTDYQAGRRFYFGGRFDYVEPLESPGHIWGLAPHITWWQSEWVYLRAEWKHLSRPDLLGRTDNDRFVFQIVWAMGPHKHESY
ncbi:MAG: hypothetical protein ACE5HT_11175 [Gemmatimonadales bacterium]